MIRRCNHVDDLGHLFWCSSTGGIAIALLSPRKLVDLSFRILII